MPHFRTFWRLAGVHPCVVMVLLLMLMYDRFLRQIGGRSFRPMILGSPIVPHLFALLGDTRDFPFFGRGQQLRMLAYAGTSMHLVRAICGPTTSRNNNMNAKIAQIIFSRIVSRTLHDLNCKMILQKSLTKLANYFKEEEFFTIEIIPPPFFLPHLYSIWKVFSLLLVLPEPSFQLVNLSTIGLTTDQLSAYNTMYLLCTMREMYMSENSAFIGFCIFFDEHEHMNTQSANREGIFDPRDYQAFMDLVTELLVLFFPKKEERSRGDHQKCIQIFDLFYQKMKKISDWNSISRLLSSQDDEYIQERLAEFPFKFQNENFQVDLEIPIFTPPVELEINVFNLLKKAEGIEVPDVILEVLSVLIHQKFESDAESRLYRLMFIFFRFLNFIRADTLECNFVFTCLVGLYSGHQFWVCDIYVDLHGWQDKCGGDFYEFFSDFCKFVDPRMHCIQMTKRSFLSFFKLMRDVLSDEHFISQLSEFLEGVKKVEDRQMVGICDICVQRSIIQLLNELTGKIVLGNHSFIQSMKPFKYCDSDIDGPSD
jgi:hypothetical protein